MPIKPISCYLLICERVLQEKDDVVSAVSLADIFFCDPESKTPIEERAVRVSMLAHLHLPMDDDSEHKLQLKIVRPSGQEALFAPLMSKVPPAKYGKNLLDTP